MKERQMKMKVGVCVAVLASMVGGAGAAMITNNAAQTAFAIPWNDAMWGDPAATSTAGNDYVKVSAGANPRGLGADGSFNGDALWVNGGAFIGKGGGAIGGFIYLNGGSWQQRAPGTGNVLGNIRVPKTSTLLLIDGGVQWSTGLGITSGQELRVQALQAGRTFIVNAIDMGVNGTIRAKLGGGDYTWDLDFMRSYSNATLAVDDGNDLRAAVYQLSSGEDIAFNEVIMPKVGGGTLNLAPGTYTGADLATAGINSAYYNDIDGTGTITVIPEPATLGLMGLVGLLALGSRRFR